MTNIELPIFMMVLAGVFALFIGYLTRKFLAERKTGKAEALARQIISEAEREAESKRREASLEAREKIHKMRAAVDRESRERRQELRNLENRLHNKDANIDRKASLLEKKEEELSVQDREIASRRAEVESKKKEVERILDEERDILGRIARLSQEEAKELLLKKMEEGMKHEAAVMAKKFEQEARETAMKKAGEIVTLAIQKCAVDQTIESTVSVVSVSDEMKGRIIGREGRNIRAFEGATGINLIVDDTPDAVTLSGFNPIRREIARIVLERLIADGRIHPSRIEEIVKKVQQEMEITIKEAGEQAAFELGIAGLHPEIIKLIGRLKYRTSYGQNVLQHSKESAHLAGVVAAELGINIKMAKRAGLLHDLGKAVDHEVEGTHITIGGDLARKYGEEPDIIDAILHHHGEGEPQTLLAVVIQTVDAISGSRPGARREILETYVQRLEKLEKIAASFPGVERAYAISAGREVRVMVKPEKIDDIEARSLAIEISKHIEKELEYPGQIKVTLIREVRATEYAK